MTLTNADIYISRILGGSGDTGILAQARDALKSGFEELLHRNNWTYLRQDTSLSFDVALCTPEVGTALVTTTTNGFKNVLVGMTVTDTNSEIPAGTKVASITDNLNLVLDTAGTGTTQGTITFGGTIPIKDGVEYYNLPSAFWKPMSARLTGTRKDELTYIPPGTYDAISYDQTVKGTVVAYTIYNSDIFDASGTQQTKIRFIRVPGADDTCLLRYYRLPTFSSTASDPVDVPDEYLYTFLDVARIHLLRSKDAASRRLPILIRDVEQRIARAISADREEGGDAQTDRFNTPNEIGNRYFNRIWPTNYLGRW